MTATPRPRANPYVGPRAFQQGEKLYGRDREVTQLLHLLLAERIVLLYSLSGAGKTSLIQAALIPELEKEGFHVLPPMRVSLGPSADEQRGNLSNRYVFSLLLSLEEALPPEQRTPLAELSTLTLAAYLDRRQDGDGAVGTVLIFDQFEEILTLDPIDRELKLEFFAQVGAALRDRRRWALFAMREEFIAGLEEPYLRPIPTRLRASYRLGLLVPQYAKQAIQEPAKAAGVTFSDAAADKLVRDLSTVRVFQPDGSIEKRLGPYVEPVQLQVVCRCLWDLLPAGASQIVEEDIGLLADVDLALSGYYDDQVQAARSGYYADQVQAAKDLPSRLGVYGKVFAAALGFGLTEGTIRNWFDGKLITEQGMRGQVLRGPKESEGLDNGAIRPLVGANLVRAEKRRGATWFELAHDRLIEPVQASNAAWQQARLIRWIAVGTTLIGILAIALALLAGREIGQAKVTCLETQVATLEAPVANDDSATTDEATAVNIAVMANDWDPKDTLDPSSANVTTDATNGTVVNNGDGTFEYTPDPNYSGPDSFVYEICGRVTPDVCHTATVTITVNPANTQPDVTISAPANGASFEEGEVITFTGSATDAEDEDPTANLLWESRRDGAIGWGGTFTRSDLSVGSHTITATVTDRGDSTVSETVTITVNTPNHAPVAVEDAYAAVEDTPLSVSAPGVLDNDIDKDKQGDPLTATLVSDVSNGSLTLNGDGSFSYTPRANYSGSDSFTYKANDGIADSNVVTASITVTSVNDAPVAEDDDTYSTDEDTTLNESAPGVLDNDTDAEGDPLTATLVSDVSNGSLTLNGDGSFSYTPRANYSGSDSFTYKANDGTADSNVVTVSITVNPGNEPPVAVNDIATTDEATAVTIDVAANDRDVNLDPSSANITTAASNGTVINNGDGTFEYTPNLDYNGPDSFVYKICDSGAPALCNTATVAITVPCRFEAQGPFAGLWRRHRDQLGCPKAATPIFIQDAEQAFENGRMFWRADTEQLPAVIYVVYDERGDGACAYQTFPNTWSEGDGCDYFCEPSPPQGLFPPVRGFREAWCRLCLRTRIGWGLEGERGFGSGYGDPLVQEFQRGLIFRDSEGKTQGQAYVLFADGKCERVPY